MIRRNYYGTIHAAKYYASVYAKQDQYPWYIWVVATGYMIKPAHETYTFKKIATADVNGKVVNQ